MRKVFGLALLTMGIAGVAFAGVPAPEIDPSLAVSALALLGGGVLVIRGRRRKS